MVDPQMPVSAGANQKTTCEIWQDQHYLHNRPSQGNQPNVGIWPSQHNHLSYVEPVDVEWYDSFGKEPFHDH